jgi:hypothetical protein
VTERRSSSTSEGVAIGVFAGVELTALVLWLVLARSLWFYYDEWDFLATRKAGNLGDLFRPHNEHWQTVPILVYRGLYGIFGLRTYLPYQLLIVLLHLAAAALLFVIMRRAHVRTWIAVAAASSFALFGAGSSNIVRAFQIGFTGALVFGLAHLLLADHDGRIDRRDWLGLLAGVLGLMTSGVAVAMTIVVGLAVLARRGWRAALFHTVPLATCYLAWFLAIGRRHYQTTRPGASVMLRFVATGLRGTYRAMGQLPGVGLVLAVVLVVGLTLAYVERHRSGRGTELAAVGALLVGAVLFLVVSGAGRAAGFGPEFARASRYLHLVAAMTIPALAVAADALTTRRRWFFPVAIALFVVGIPGNVRSLADTSRKAAVLDQATRRLITSLPRDPLTHAVPRKVRPEPLFAHEVTVGWLLDAAAQHRLPESRRLSAAEIAADNFRLSFVQRPRAARPDACKPVTRPVSVTLRKGDVLGLYDNPISVRPDNGRLLVPSIPLFFKPADGSSIVVLRNAGPVHITSTNVFAPARVCTPKE